MKSVIFNGSALFVFAMYWMQGMLFVNKPGKFRRKMEIGLLRIGCVNHHRTWPVQVEFVQYCHIARDKFGDHRRKTLFETMQIVLLEEIPYTLQATRRIPKLDRCFIPPRRRQHHSEAIGNYAY